MKNPQEIAETIKSIAKSKNVVVSKMLFECELNKNTISTMQSGGYFPRVDTLTKIADYLDCSVDYLLGRTDDVRNAPALTSGELTEHERLVLKAYRNKPEMQSSVDKLLDVPTGGISIAEDISETIRKIEAVSKADIKQK